MFTIRLSGSKYSMPKALLAGFGRNAYGTKAAKRVENYWRHRDTKGGPPSDQTFINFGPAKNETRDGKKEWFCSMFTIACFQAAMENHDQVKANLPLDSRYTSPMTLHGFLSTSSRWELIGKRT